MSNVHVIPAEGFTVVDHQGQPIPAEGGTVLRTPVIERRIREGLLEVIEEEVEGGTPAPAATKAKIKVPVKVTAPDEGGSEPDDEDEEVDIDAMTATELKEELRSRGIEFRGNASAESLREQLIEAVAAEGEAGDE